MGGQAPLTLFLLAMCNCNSAFKTGYLQRTDLYFFFFVREKQLSVTSQDKLPLVLAGDKQLVSLHFAAF